MEIYITQDSLNLFFGFKIFDYPKQIRANIVRQDNIENDDIVGIALAPFNQKQIGFAIFV